MFHIYSSAIKYLCAKYTIFFLHRGEKTRRTPLIRGDQRPPPRLEEGEIPQRQEEQEEEDVVELVTTTGDRDVVDPGHFTSESAQIPIGEIMGCNVALENIKKNINDVIQKIRTSLMFWGEFKTPPNPFLLWCARIF
ncbi:hypothetical protein AB205_0004470 [Aquarana catesbeiana]|uniref:Uncharacterized protein n=1 Tax=Aquarana catesbeiana TaxID=8400 RepID=A0A2G9RLN4_AQUCT|nr:hypothetical protein AB205_0004470 [Aquarana catesbeiana]